MHRSKVPVRSCWSHHETGANPAWPVLGFRLPNLSGSFRIGNLRQRPCYFDLVRYFFLNLSKTDISEIFRFLVFRRIEAEQENDQSEDDRDCAHGLFTCRKIAKAMMANSTPSNGLDT